MKLINVLDNKKTHEIILKYRENTKYKYEKIKYENYFFCNDKNGDYEFVLDASIKCKKVANINLADFEKDTKRIDRYVINEYSDKFEKLDYTDLSYLFYDIETLASLDVNAIQPIISIAFTTNYNNRLAVLIWRDDFITEQICEENRTIFKFKTEKEMLLFFIKVIKQSDIIVGFNSKNFDDVYLVNRIFKLNINNELSICNKTEIFESSKEKNKFNIFSDFVFFDAMEHIIKLFSRASDIEKPSSFSLNSLSKMLLNENKIENVSIVESWKNDYTILCNYVGQDVILLKKLCEKTKILNAFVDRLNFVKVPLNKVSINSYVIDIIIRRLNRNKVFPTKKFFEIKEDLIGATVLSPIAGVYRNVAVCDFSAMYPNIILANNISPDKEKKILPELINYLMKLRTEYKVLQSKTSDISEKQILKANEMIVKDLINSCFGIFGYNGFRLYDINVANEITRKARELLANTIEYVKKELKLKVLAGDTDSFFVETGNNNVELLVNNINTTFFNKYKYYYTIECETFFTTLFLSQAKKMYIGLVNTVKGRKTEKLELYAKGFQLIRKDTPHFFKHILLEKTLQLFINFQNGHNTYKVFVSEIRNELQQLKSAKSLLINKHISMEISDYKVVPQHVRAMQFSNTHLNTHFDRLHYSGGMLFVKDNRTDVIMLDFDNDYEISNGKILVNNNAFAVDFEKYVDLFVISKFKLLNESEFNVSTQKTLFDCTKK